MNHPKPRIVLMRFNRHRVLALMLAVLALLSLAPQRARAFSYGVNLILNGNGDVDAGSPSGAHVSVTNWTTTSAFTVIPYSAGFGYPGPGDPGPGDRGSNFFAGGNGAAVSTATQNIDLSANAADINAGNVIFDLSGYFGGFSSDNDNARLSATFFNGNTSLGIVTVGHATAKDRGNATGLLLRRGSGIVPVNTTRVVITLTMTRISNTSNDGYADSLSFICNLKAGSQTTAETFSGNGTGADATGPWSDSNHWLSAHLVPNNAGNNFFDVTVMGLTVSGKLSNEDRIITRRVGAARLDISATVSNLTLTDAGLINDGFTTARANLLTVTGTTTDNSLQNQTGDNFTQTPGFTVQTQTSGADAILSLGHFTNFSGNTLSSTRMTLFSQGPAATVQFNGADIVTLSNASITLTGSNAHIIDEVGNDALRHLAVIGTGGVLSIRATDFVTGGNLTINGSLGLLDNGLDTSFTVTGALTNFDPATKTLTGGSIGMQAFLSATANVIFRFNGADIVNNASSIGITSPTARIVDQNGLDALRNFAHNLAAGSVSFTDHNFSSAGAFTNDGSLSLNGQSLPTVFTVNSALTNFDPATKTLTGGVFRIFGSFSNQSATGTLRFNGADIVHNAADLTLGGAAMIADQSSNNGLRNFVDNTKAGAFTLLGQSFAAPTDFTNAGALFISNFDPSQVFSVAGGHSYIQTGGETSLGDSILTAANVLIQGGIIHHGGTINGNVNVSRGTIAPTSGGGGGNVDLGAGVGIIVVPGSYLIPGPDTMTINGNLALGADAHYSMVIRNNTAGEFDTMNVSGSATFGGTLDVSLVNGFVPQAGDSFTVLTAGSPITGAFTNAPNGSRFPTTDGHGSFIATYSDNHLVLSNFVTKPPDQLLNISTRMRVLTGDNVLIAGFIITGTDPKKVIIRGLGPSLGSVGVQGALTDTTLELHQGANTLATNDNWKINDQSGQSQEATIRATTIPPTDDMESALVAILNPGDYTAVLSGKNQTIGIGVVEVYDLDQAANSKLANISSRGFVDTGDNAMIGGFIVGGAGGGAAKVIVRGIAPSLPFSGTLQDPTLELHDNNGNTIATDDNWKDSQQGDVQATTIPPTNEVESAIVRTLVPGNYTAVVRGVNNSTGIAVVEVYNLQ
jgi:hypothetical protein